jgi:hypothetical protein
MNDGYGEIKYRAQHGMLVFEQFKNARGMGRWEDAANLALRNHLEEHGLTAAVCRIYDGFCIQLAGLGAKSNNLMKVPGSSDSKWVEDTLLAYTLWTKEAVRKYGFARLDDALDILCRGIPMSHVDEKRKQRNGTAKDHLIGVVMLYEGVK